MNKAYENNVYEKDDLEEKSLGCLMSTFIGDTIALPVECLSPQKIKNVFGYLNKHENNKYHPYQSVAKQPAGTKSDDSQLQLCLMNSLRRKNKFDIDDIKLSHIEAYEGKWGEPVGWGGSTRTAIYNIKNNKFPTYAPGGAGNGPVIKIAPLAIYCAYKTSKTINGKFADIYNYSLLKKCKEISLITHEDPSCIVACYCHCKMIIRALQNEVPKQSDEIANIIIKDAQYAEEKLQLKPFLSVRLESILNLKFQINDTCLSIFDLETGTVSNMICQKNSSWIYNSYPLTAYCVAKYFPLKNFRHAILETANAGADADSNTSMVGAIIGADLGFKSIPIDMIKGMADWKLLLTESKQFLLAIG